MAKFRQILAIRRLAVVVVCPSIAGLVIVLFYNEDAVRSPCKSSGKLLGCTGGIRSGPGINMVSIYLALHPTLFALIISSSIWWTMRGCIGALPDRSESGELLSPELALRAQGTHSNPAAMYHPRVIEMGYSDLAYGCASTLLRGPL